MEITFQERTTRRHIQIKFSEDQIEQLVKDKLIDSNIDIRRAKSLDIQFNSSQGYFDYVSVDIVFEETEEES